MTATYADLVARGCTCGTEARDCPLHKPGDNRGLAAWLRAGQPMGFPMEDCTCAVCGAGGSMIYPDWRLEESGKRGDKMPDVDHGPSLVCPRCSSRNVEAFLRYKAESLGHDLKPVGVFTTETAYAPEAA